MESAVKILFDAVLERINTLFIKVKEEKKIAIFSRSNFIMANWNHFLKVIIKRVTEC